MDHTKLGSHCTGASGAAAGRQTAAALAGRGEACATKPGAQRVSRKPDASALGAQAAPPGGKEKPSGHCVATGSMLTPKASSRARPRPAAKRGAEREEAASACGGAMKMKSSAALKIILDSAAGQISKWAL